jgi:hypothetical protein
MSIRLWIGQITQYHDCTSSCSYFIPVTHSKIIIKHFSRRHVYLILSFKSPRNGILKGKKKTKSFPVGHELVMDTGKPGRIGAETAPFDFKQSQDQFRVARSASRLVLRPTSFVRGVGMLMQLILFKNIVHRAKQLTYAAVEASGSTYLCYIHLNLHFNELVQISPSFRPPITPLTPIPL